jgi:hypothetical protein
MYFGAGKASGGNAEVPERSQLADGPVAHRDATAAIALSVSLQWAEKEETRSGEVFVERSMFLI